MIGFWILAGLAAVVAIAIIGYAMVAAKGNTAATAAYDVQVYRTQLKELDRDLARGVIRPEEVQRARVEISRRLLDADRKLQAGETEAKAPAALTWSAVALATAVIAGGGMWLYADLGAPGYWDMPIKGRFEAAAEARAGRISQAEAEAGVPDWAGPPPEAPADYIALVDKLRIAVANRPDDYQGQALLAQHESALGNYRAAHAAFARMIELKGEATTASDYAQYTDLLVLATNGYVSPEAEDALTKALRLDPGEPVALFYAGLMHAQTGRPDVAFPIWRDLLESSDPSEPWVAPIAAEIGRLAALAGVDYTPPMMGSDMPGPSAADMAAAEDMTPEDRADMINGMVARLMDRLATEGGTAAEWAQLISVLGVQGNLDRAATIWGEARQVFAARPADLAQIDAAAAEAGLSEPTPFTPPEGGAAPAPSAPALAGPSAEDMAAAAEMSAEDRNDMIASMVARLEDELMSEGGAPERWVQLFNVLGVLGDPERAKAAWAKAQADFSGDEAALAQIRAAAVAVGAFE